MQAKALTHSTAPEAVEDTVGMFIQPSSCGQLIAFESKMKTHRHRNKGKRPVMAVWTSS